MITGFIFLVLFFLILVTDYGCQTKFVSSLVYFLIYVMHFSFACLTN